LFFRIVLPKIAPSTIHSNDHAIAIYYADMSRKSVDHCGGESLQLWTASMHLAHEHRLL